MAVREITCSQAIAEALAEEMERDNTVFILGEDLVSNGGIFCLQNFFRRPKFMPNHLRTSPVVLARTRASSRGL